MSSFVKLLESGLGLLQRFPDTLLVKAGIAIDPLFCSALEFSERPEKPFLFHVGFFFGLRIRLGTFGTSQAGQARAMTRRWRPAQMGHNVGSAGLVNQKTWTSE